MYFCCSSKKKRVALQADEIRKALQKTRFQQAEVKELQQRFYKMSKNTGRLRKEQFREQMGVLGMDTVFFLSDRIFTMLDSDGDGEITFMDFINYFDIISNGTQEQRSRMAFNYIDIHTRGFFELGDLRLMIGGIINSWSAVTGAHLNEDLLRRVDYFINHIFGQMDIEKNGQVRFGDYCEAINKNPKILELFEYLNKGITESIGLDDENIRSKEEGLTKRVKSVERSIDNIIAVLEGAGMQTNNNLEYFTTSIQKKSYGSSIHKQSYGSSLHRLPSDIHNIPASDILQSQPWTLPNIVGPADPFVIPNQQTISQRALTENGLPIESSPLFLSNPKHSNQQQQNPYSIKNNPSLTKNPPNITSPRKLHRTASSPESAHPQYAVFSDRDATTAMDYTSNRQDQPFLLSPLQTPQVLETADLLEKPKELQAPNKDMLSSVSFKCLDNNWLEGDTKKDSQQAIARKMLNSDSKNGNWMSAEFRREQSVEGATPPGAPRGYQSDKKNESSYFERERERWRSNGGIGEVNNENQQIKESGKIQQAIRDIITQGKEEIHHPSTRSVVLELRGQTIEEEEHKSTERSHPDKIRSKEISIDEKCVNKDNNNNNNNNPVVSSLEGQDKETSSNKQLEEKRSRQHSSQYGAELSFKVSFTKFNPKLLLKGDNNADEDISRFLSEKSDSSSSSSNISSSSDEEENDQKNNKKKKIFRNKSNSCTLEQGIDNNSNNLVARNSKEIILHEDHIKEDIIYGQEQKHEGPNGDHNFCSCLPIPPMLQERRAAGDKSKLMKNNWKDNDNEDDDDNNEDIIKPGISSYNSNKPIQFGGSERLIGEGRQIKSKYALTYNHNTTKRSKLAMRSFSGDQHNIIGNNNNNNNNIWQSPKKDESQTTQDHLQASQTAKSVFFKETLQSSSIPQNKHINNTNYQRFVRRVNQQTNEQLKDKIVSLYSTFSYMKDTLKGIREDLKTLASPKEDHTYNNTPPSPQPAVANIPSNKNLLFFPSTDNLILSPTPTQIPRQIQPSLDNHRNSNSINPVSQHLIQGEAEQFRTMRASTAINVPKRVVVSKTLISKRKTMVFFGHQNWNLVINMMMGVQMAVRSVSGMGLSFDKVEPQDYGLKYYFELLPRRRVGEESTFKICKFSDYAPQVFRQIRSLFGVKSDSYLKSIGPDAMFSSLLKGDLATLSELTSTGKSGSFFYYSADSKFTLKTIQQSEFTFLKKILPAYHKHLNDHPNTLIIRVYGLHKIKYRLAHSILHKYVYFIIMSNVFHTRKEIHTRFDLKGSTYKRFSNDIDPSVAKKDLDFLKQNIKISVRNDQYNNFMEAVRKDCQFFEQNKVIDYSMLLGLNYTKRDKRTSEIETMNFIDTFEEEPDSLCLMKSRTSDITYHFGIIDILTCFGPRKKLEYLVKRVAIGNTVSTVPPLEYAERFLQFIDQAFDETSKKPILANSFQHTVNSQYPNKNFSNPPKSANHLFNNNNNTNTLNNSNNFMNSINNNNNNSPSIINNIDSINSPNEESNPQRKPSNNTNTNNNNFLINNSYSFIQNNNTSNHIFQNNWIYQNTNANNTNSNNNHTNTMHNLSNNNLLQEINNNPPLQQFPNNISGVPRKDSSSRNRSCTNIGLHSLNKLTNPNGGVDPMSPSNGIFSNLLFSSLSQLIEPKRVSLSKPQPLSSSQQQQQLVFSDSASGAVAGHPVDQS